MAASLHELEPFFDKQGIAGFFSCSVRWIEERMTEGLPHFHIAGKAKFRASQVESWLHEHGHITTKGEAA